MLIFKTNVKKINITFNFYFFRQAYIFIRKIVKTLNLIMKKIIILNKINFT